MEEQKTRELPKQLQDWIERQNWRKSKNPMWPHSYVMHHWTDSREEMIELATFIRDHGRDGFWYKTPKKYLEHEGMTYWYMDEKMEDTTIINRCYEYQSYDARAKAGTLPHQLKEKKANRLQRVLEF